MIYQPWPPEALAMFKPPTFRLITYTANTRVDAVANTRTDSSGNIRTTKEAA